MSKISKTIKNGVTYDFHDASIGSIANDHLEEKAPVGELYTINDDVFLQQTPDLDDSTIEQAVGNTADNTQIHIQRVSSGTASNKLKLKIKKVGNPGDLTVQVMKGISVVVTADVEAYWYGDSSNTIASGTLSASNVTTSFQELEVTLNASFGGAQEELLNVVLSQASVDASNYYVIACDSTQWSEGFSFVAVNGNTRTRSKVMPYCTSAGFAQGLLCKVSDTVIPTTGGTVIYSGHTESVDYDTAWNNGLVMYTNNSGGQQTYKVDLGTYCSWGNNGLYVGPKTGQYNNPEGTSTGQYNRVYSNSTPLTIEDGESLRAYCAWGRSGVSGNVTINSLIINPIDYTLVKTGAIIYPRVQGQLGGIVPSTTFGKHIDGERIEHGNGGGDVFDYIRNHTFGNGTELSANQEYTMQSDGYVKGTAYTYDGGGYFTIGSIEHSITGGNFGSGYHPTIYLKAYKGEVVKLLYKTNVNLYVYEQTD